MVLRTHRITRTHYGSEHAAPRSAAHALPTPKATSFLQPQPQAPAGKRRGPRVTSNRLLSFEGRLVIPSPLHQHALHDTALHHSLSPVSERSARYLRNVVEADNVISEVTVTSTELGFRFAWIPP